MESLKTAVLGAALVLLGTTASAHHAFSAEFDAEQPVTLQGSVALVQVVAAGT